MDFSAEGILARMKAALKNEDTKMEGSFSMDNLQAVAEELARLDAMRIVPLMNTLTDKEEDMGTSGNERHYVRWAKEATDAEGNVIVGNAKVDTPRDGTGLDCDSYSGCQATNGRTDCICPGIHKQYASGWS